MPALVFGVGFLGAALVERLCAAGERVVGVDNGFAVDDAALAALAQRWPERFELMQGDVRDVSAVDGAFRRAAPVSAVHLLAAQASAHPEAAPPEYTEETNLRGPRIVLEAAVRHGAPRVVYGSSFHVYGSPLSGVVDEQRPYGAFRDLQHLSKVYAEKLGELFANEHGVPFAPVRLGIVYGAGPVMKRDYRFVTVPHAFCLRALTGEQLTVSPSGAAPLAFVHLDDAVDALLAAPAAGYAPANAVGEVASVAEVATAVKAAARGRGLSPSIVLPDTPLEPSAFSVSTRLSAAGWRPTRKIAESVGEVMERYAA